MEVSGSFHAPAALPRGKSSRYPLDKRLGEPQRPMDAVEKREFSYLAGNRTRFLDHRAHSLVAMLTEVFWLQKRGRNIKIYMKEIV
jgi:hypothetical protein